MWHSTTDHDAPARAGGRVREVVAVLARLGAVAFGGPAAHVALLEAECVGRRAWCDRRRFLDMLAVSSLIPGPTSTELALHLGRLRAGWPGLLAGGLAWMAPGTLLIAALAWAYERAGTLPATGTVLEAIRPAVVVVIADAVRRLARQAIPDGARAGWALAAAALGLAGVSEAGIVLAALALAAAVGGVAPHRLRAVPLGELFLAFLWIGATLFGSGYVLVGYLEDVLGTRGWLDGARILDAVAAGQVTPGPLFSTATFVGYLLAGWPGAAVATAGIFLPCFVLVACTGPLLERWRAHPRVRGALDAVNAAVVGLVAAVLVRLLPAALSGGFQLAIALGATLAIASGRLGSTGVLLASLAAGVARAWWAGR